MATPTTPRLPFGYRIVCAVGNEHLKKWFVPGWTRHDKCACGGAKVYLDYEALTQHQIKNHGFK